MTEQEIKTAKHTIEIRQMEINDLNKYIELTRLFKDLFRWNHMDYSLLIKTAEAQIEKCKDHIIQLEKEIAG